MVRRAKFCAAEWSCGLSDEVLGAPSGSGRVLSPAQNDWAALCKHRIAPLLSRTAAIPVREVTMPLPARFSLLHSDLNDFLFASVGEEQNGVTLSVVSGLTRLGLDPWEEAARLTPLPKAQAAKSLAKLVARLPICRAQSSDDLATSRTIGGTLASKDGGFAGPAGDMVGADKLLVGSDSLRQPCRCYCGSRQHVVIGAPLLRRHFADALWSNSLSNRNIMKYLIPPIVIPVLLIIGVVAYGMLRPPIIAGHSPVPAANSPAR